MNTREEEQNKLIAKIKAQKKALQELAEDKFKLLTLEPHKQYFMFVNNGALVPELLAQIRTNENIDLTWVIVDDINNIRLEERHVT